MNTSQIDPAGPDGPAITPRRSSIGYALQFLAICLLVYTFLGGRSWDVRTPIGFSSDGLFFNALGKAVVDEGWWFETSHAGYPFGAQYLSFPTNNNVDFLFVRLASLGTSDASVAMALAWIAMLATGGVICTFCLRLLGVSWTLSLCVGILFGLTPFAIYRAVTQICLCPYLVPLPATLALLTWRPPHFAPKRGFRYLLYAGCALIGLNYIYHAFFAAAVLTFALAFGIVRRKSGANWRLPAVGLALVLVATAVNLVPSLFNWYTHGMPPNIREKLPMEFDYYGLKIRHLVTPLWEHSFPPFSSWVNRDNAANFPLETENASARLGLVAAVGFIFLLGSAVLPAKFWKSPFRRTHGLARGILIALLLYSVVGGFGSVFNLLISPDIRAANRVTPWLAFFSLFALCAGLESLRRNPVGLLGSRAGQIVLATLVLGIGLYDQRHAFVGLRRSNAAQSAEAHTLRSFVTAIESSPKPPRRALQYPFTTFLNDDGRYRMGTYDHFRPQLFSQKIQWSYPTISQQAVNWETYAHRLPPSELVGFAQASGFDMLWVDRFGLNGGAEEAEFLRIIGTPPTVSPDGRYAAYDLSSLATPADRIQQDVRGLLAHDVWLTFNHGFYNGEPNGASILRWSRRHSEVSLHNHSPSPVTANFHGVLRTLLPGPINIRCTAPGFSQEIPATSQGTPFVIPLQLAPNATVTIKFEQLAESIKLPNDSRDLYFGLIDPYITFP